MVKIEKASGILPLRRENGCWLVLLALHVKGDYWSFPKGHINPDESSINGAKRELFEETNLTVEKLIEQPPFKEDYQFIRDHQKIHKYVEYFPAVVKGELLIKEPSEIKDLQWFSFEEALEKITFQESQKVLMELKKNI